MLYTVLIYAPHPGHAPPAEAGSPAILDDHQELQHASCALPGRRAARRPVRWPMEPGDG